MQTVEFGNHHYVDLSDLNAKWDQALPAVAGLGLGTSNGILSGNALKTRAVGQSDPAFPWREESPDTMALQEEVNEVLGDAGYNLIEEDGKLGPGTCGALREIYQATGESWAMPPGTCQSFTAPTLRGSGGGARTTTPTVPSLPPSSAPVVSRAGMSGGPNWLLVGAGVGLLAIGTAVILKNKKR